MSAEILSAYPLRIHLYNNTAGLPQSLKASRERKSAVKKLRYYGESRIRKLRAAIHLTCFEFSKMKP